MLDSRPLKTPKANVIKIPSTYEKFATLAAFEWDILDTSKARQHSLPLTSLASRAIDYLDKSNPANTHDQAVEQLAKYLNTDTLLFFAPSYQGEGKLLALQNEQWLPLVKWATEYLGLPQGVELTKSETEIFSPVQQPEQVSAHAKKWLNSLDLWTLAAAERAILASKSFIVGMRLVAESSGEVPEAQILGVDKLADIANLEVNYQTGQWGEVEDSK